MSLRASLLLPILPVVLSACASGLIGEPAGTPRQETVLAVTEAHELIRFNAGTPRQVQQRLPIRGLEAGEALVGIDFRVARGVLYGLTSAGRLVTIHTGTAQLQTVGSANPARLQGGRFGFDFNPVADRIRVVSNTGQNLRLHPDTGAVAAIDPPLANERAVAPPIAGAAYTYNTTNDRLTTNYAIDLERGWLVTQGSVETREPVVSPNTGRINDVGALGTGPVQDVQFDIADINNAALAALRQGGRTRLFSIDLSTGHATLLGSVDRGGALRGLAIEP